MTSLFQHTKENPFHISVGAVLVDRDGRICIHSFPAEKLPQDVRDAIGEREKVSVLMRESLEEGETLDEAVRRGLKEEFGAEGAVRRYLGSIRGRAFSEIGAFEKTTLYFQVELTHLGERPDDEENFSDMEWVEPKELVERMRSQRNDLRDDLDESKIVEAYLCYGR